MTQDSTVETCAHILKVQRNIYEFIKELTARGILHDRSKLEEPEKPYFDKWTPMLSSVTYGSDEYREMLNRMRPAIDHHQGNNRHHPEYFKNGVDDMNLIDLVEMLCDWMAAAKRHADGDVRKSIPINQERHGLSPQLVAILMNTVDALEN